MRFHKTFTSDRSVYTYEFFNDDDKKVKFVIKPDRDGVTEVDIKSLHLQDDNEVDNNIANCRPEPTSREQQIKKKWKENYIRDFEQKYGYVPCNADLKFVLNEVFPPNWTLSIEESDELYEERASLFSSEQKKAEEDANEAIKDRIALLLKDLSPRDWEIYRRVLLNRETKISVAADLGISDSYVCRVAKRIIEILASDDFLKKFFIFGSDSGKVRPLS